MPPSFPVPTPKDSYDLRHLRVPQTVAIANAGKWNKCMTKLRTSFISTTWKEAVDLQREDHN
ncbi:hypothetical protein FRX31_023072 [Thalictrum thalictroides]|uniref:Uncharacterized protein n=1 Tax=Thalictrum thalictroides TaxID=46969 RepID=A0A7J6VRF3_THATH|nr:hypothetical protein FRX31_023072 [Thalictrum thalictroides]